MTERSHRYDDQWSEAANTAIASTPAETTVIVSIGSGPLPSESKGTEIPNWLWLCPLLWLVPLSEN